MTMTMAIIIIIIIIIITIIIIIIIITKGYGVLATKMECLSIQRCALRKFQLSVQRILY